VAQAQAYVLEGYHFAVDIDLAKFFDRVHHDRLLAAMAARISDRRLLRVIRAYLTAGVLDGGLFEESREGVPQSGPLSPLLSNLVLDELERELERRGHRFVRYADDCNVYVRSEKAGRRVMASLTRFIERRLKLQVNADKSAVAHPWERSFLGFTVRNEPAFRRCIGAKAITRFKDRVRVLTRRHRGIPVERMIADLAPVLRGWVLRFRTDAITVALLGRVDPASPALRRLGPVEDAASALPGTAAARGFREGGQRTGLEPQGTLLAAQFHARPAPRLCQRPLPAAGPALDGELVHRLIRRTAVVRTRMPGGVGGAASRDAPYPD
jgi:hypothetical protein